MNENAVQEKPSQSEGSTVTDAPAEKNQAAEDQTTVQQNPNADASNTDVNPVMEDGAIQQPDVETQQIQLTTTNLTVKSEITAGDFLVSTLLTILIVIQIVIFFHKLILGRKTS